MSEQRCTNPKCGKVITVQIFKNTNWCSAKCWKALGRPKLVTSGAANCKHENHIAFCSDCGVGPLEGLR